MKPKLLSSLVSILSAVLMLSVSACGGGGGDDDRAETGSPTVVFGASACSVVGFQKSLKVANGEACTVDSRSDTSSIVEIQITDAAGNQFICTGTVISPTAVLTAAHCFASNPVLVEVVATVQGARQRRFAKSYRIHPDFQDAQNGFFYDDVAVVLMNRDLAAPPTPILLSREALKGEESAVAGYGQTKEGAPTDGVLRAGRASIRNVTPNHIFISFTENESHPCRGDSGGALLVQEQGRLSIVGVVSQSAPNVPLEVICSVGDETLYTNMYNPSVSSFVLSVVPDAAVN
jgi:secreted trypsin-like serine protease